LLAVVAAVQVQQLLSAVRLAVQVDTDRVR
jgi:hypothetical protein